MSSVYYKNLVDTVIRQSIRIDEDEEYLIPVENQFKWSNDVDVLNDIISFNAQIGDGTQYFTDVGLALDHLRGISSVNINNISDGVILTEKQVGFRDLTGHNLWVKGFLYDVTAGQDIEFAEKYSNDLYIQGGKIWTDNNVNIGDYIELSITDEDNLLGYGSGFQLVKFIESLYAHSNFIWECTTDDAKLIPTGFYTNLKYHSTGSNNIKVSVSYKFRTA